MITVIFDFNPGGFILARDVCSNCAYPKAVCLCAEIKPLNHQTQVIILRHSSEASVAKGTARLVALCSRSTLIVDGETEEDFIDVKQQLGRAGIKPVLIYPGEKVLSIEEDIVSRKSYNCLIFLDGTWKKTYKLLKLNSWLLDIPQCTFSQVLSSKYTIRKSQKSYGLSTLEAVAYSLQLVEGIDTSSLSQLQQAMINKFSTFLPDSQSH